MLKSCGRDLHPVPLGHCCSEYAVHSLLMTSITFQGRIRRSEARIVPYRTPHEGEPEIFQNQAVMAARWRDRRKPFEEIDRTAQQIKKISSIDQTL